MQTKELETIPLSQLKLGMVVHQIGEQTGRLVVKQKGKINNAQVIDQLGISGVRSVIVERPQSNETLAKLNKQKQHLQAQKTKPEPEQYTTDLSVELEQANVLFKQSLAIHKSLAESIKIGLNVELGSAEKMMTGIYDSLHRNPNALLSLSLILQSDKYLANHATHVSILMCYFAKKIGMTQEECQRLGLLGYLYDIGMLKIPKYIIEKPSELDKNEKETVKQHVQHSLDLLDPLNLDSEIMLAVEQHHERLDGSGYPNGYSGSKIHKFSRMLAIVDSYDALTSKRPYSKARSPTCALKILSDPKNGYDEKLVLQFVRHIGIYPAGSLVALSNNRVAMVTRSNVLKPTCPEVKVFYSLAGNHYLPHQTLNLSKQNNGIKITRPVMAEQYKLNIDQIL